MDDESIDLLRSVLTRVDGFGESLAEVLRLLREIGDQQLANEARLNQHEDAIRKLARHVGVDVLPEAVTDER